MKRAPLIKKTDAMEDSPATDLLPADREATPAPTGGAASAPVARIFHFKDVAPGTWYVLHLLAAHGERSAFGGLMRVLQSSFICVSCRKHLRAYISKNPFQDAPDLCIWITKFHNAVSTRIMQETGAYKMVLTEEGCAAVNRELTTQAADDERIFNDTGVCEACGPE